jgi:hypothetical protein
MTRIYTLILLTLNEHFILVIGHAEVRLAMIPEAVATYKLGLEKEPGNPIITDRLSKA